jgi:uncharacterized protein YceK
MTANLKSNISKRDSFPNAGNVDQVAKTPYLKLSALATGLLILSGCSTMVSYSPKESGPDQAVRYDQGVGTLSIKNDDHEIFIYPTFKMQSAEEPTFTISFVNKGDQPVNFSVENVKAYFGTRPIQVYSYEEKVAEIQTTKRSKQIALAILGGVAAVAAANAASQQTYTGSYSGSVWNRRGATSFVGSNTVQVNDPMRGFVAGAAVGGATGLGIRQIEFNAQNQELAANNILQQNTVDPQRVVTGNIILKDCCEMNYGVGQPIRLEVSINDKVSSFKFVRTSGGKLVAVDGSTTLAQGMINVRPGG